jgi:ABC-type nitrate/sulfonate/bicarbonate transport system substrate-binding protein
MKGLAPSKTLTLALALAALLLAPPAHAQTKLRVGICARTVSMGVGSPFAIAMKMGWFKQEGLEVEQSYLELIHKTSTIRVIG